MKMLLADRKIPLGRNIFTALVAVSIAIAVGLPAACLAQDSQAPFTVAVVNLQKISGQFTERDQAIEQLKQWMQAKDNVYQQLQTFMPLSDADFLEAQQILAMPAPLPQDRQKRLEELKQLAESKLKEFVDLKNKPNRTVAEEDRYKTLSEQYSRCEAALAKFADDARAEFEQKQREIENRLGTKVLNAIKTVASQKGYSLVLSLDSVLYAVAPVVDITDEVIAVLNPAAAETSGEQPAPGASASSGTETPGSTEQPAGGSEGGAGQ